MLSEQNRRLVEANAFVRHNGIEITDITPEHVSARLTMTPESCNPYGFLHGGGYFTMADAAGAYLARADGRAYVTLSCGMNFIRSITAGTAFAEAALRHRGRGTCVVSVDVTDADGRLLASGDFTYYCLSGHSPAHRQNAEEDAEKA